jgi:apolipoprotein N-acyltransferase
MVRGLVSLLVGTTCWIIGDGKSLGINPPISENVKLGITLLGWPYVIDGVRMLSGRRSFMRYVHRYGFYLLCCLAMGWLAVFLVVWIYRALSLKGLVAIGLTAAIALLVFILRELRGSRTPPARS